MQNYAAQDEILYHVGLSREMLKGAEYAFCPVTPAVWKHLPNAWTCTVFKYAPRIHKLAGSG